MIKLKKAILKDSRILQLKDKFEDKNLDFKKAFNEALETCSETDIEKAVISILNILEGLLADDKKSRNIFSKIFLFVLGIFKKK